MVRLTSLRQGYGGPPKRFARRRKPDPTNAAENLPIGWRLQSWSPLALVAGLAPHMLERGSGVIVNVGSMGGRLTFPGGGYYHATKHALEAISDALRFEVQGFGIDVILLEPGLITTEFGEAAAASLQHSRAEPAQDGEPYARFNAAVGAVTKGAYDGGLSRLGAGPDRVARAIERALHRRRPPTRIVITPSAKLTIAMRRLLSDRAWDAAMRRQFPQPR